MDKQITDIELLSSIKDGDQVAYKSLFTKYYKGLVYTSFKLCQDQQKARDFAQEVFLDIWKRRETLRITGSVNAYLTKAAKNKTIDYLRSKRISFQDDVGKDLVEKPSSNLEYNDLKKQIHRIAEELPDRCRQIFFMSRLEQLSHKEIASILNISTNTIENQISKALKLMRERLRKN